MFHDDETINDNEEGACLMRAIEEGDEMKVFHMLLNGADVNYQDNEGYTPLMATAILGLPNIAGLLIMFGADSEVQDYEGVRAGEHAWCLRNYEVFSTIYPSGTALLIRRFRCVLYKLGMED